MTEFIIEQTTTAINELITLAKLKENDILVVGCSSSEVLGERIGSHSSEEIGDIIFKTINNILKEKNIFLAAQCCEHLNRAIIIEKDALVKYNLEQINVVPQPKAGGSFATACYNGFNDPIAVEEIKADAGIDIGLTLIGMHLKKVAVPVRLSINKIGEAMFTCARTRPRCIGGIRAIYDDNLM